MNSKKDFSVKELRELAKETWIKFDDKNFNILAKSNFIEVYFEKTYGKDSMNKFRTQGVLPKYFAKMIKKFLPNISDKEVFIVNAMPSLLLVLHDYGTKTTSFKSILSQRFKNCEKCVDRFKNPLDLINFVQMYFNDYYKLRMKMLNEIKKYNNLQSKTRKIYRKPSVKKN